MATNKLLTQNEKDEVMQDGLEYATTILYNAMDYVGAKKNVKATITGPDGKNYGIWIWEDKDGTGEPPAPPTGKQASK